MAAQGDWLTGGLTGLALKGADWLSNAFAGPADLNSIIKSTGYDPTVKDPNSSAAHAAVLSANAAAAQGPYAGTGGGGSYDANTDPGLVASARNTVNPLIAQLHQLYGDFNNQIDQYATDKRGVLDSNYNTNVTNDTNSFNKTNDQTNGLMTARGLADSSYLGNALQGNKNDFNAALTNDKNAYGDSLDQLGSTIAGAKATVASEPQYDLGAYNDVNSLLSLRDALDTHIGNLQSAKTNLLTSGQLRDKLNSIAPAGSNLAATLKGRLDSLAGSGAPSADAYGLGQGYIANFGMSKADQDKWTTYLSGLLSGSKPKAA